jgi:hypothetical protein
MSQSVLGEYDAKARSFEQYCADYSKTQKSGRTIKPRGGCEMFWYDLMKAEPALNGLLLPEELALEKGKGNAPNRPYWSVFVCRVASLFGTFECAARARAQEHGPQRSRSLSCLGQFVFTKYLEGTADILLRLSLGKNYMPFDHKAVIGAVAGCIGAQPSSALMQRALTTEPSVLKGYDADSRWRIEVAQLAAYAVSLDDLTLARKVVPEDKKLFARQPVSNDGASLYRSIAVSLLYRLTGVLFDYTRPFSEDVLLSKPEGWKREVYSVSILLENADVNDADMRASDRLIALGANILTLWVKFYVYVLACSEQSVSVTWEGGILGLDEVVAPITVPSFYLLTEDAAMRKSIGSKVPVPSLACVVAFVSFLRELRDINGRYATWEKVRKIVTPLLRVPWDAIPVGEPRRLPLPFGAKGINDRLMWNLYVTKLRQFQEYGGQSEVSVFSSLLADAHGRGVLPVASVSINQVLWYEKGERASDIEPKSMQIIAPILAKEYLARKESQVLNVLFDQSQYEALVDATNKVAEESTLKVKRNMQFGADMDQYVVREYELIVDVGDGYDLAEIITQWRLMQ